MAADPKPVSYTYEQATTVLSHLGFSLAGSGGSSHRKWRRKVGQQPAVTIGLVDRGHGPLKRVYIEDMIRILRDAGLLAALDEE